MMLALRGAAVSAVLCLASAASPPPIGPNEAIIFADHFSGPLLNTSVWKHELTLSGEGNWEFEWYSNNRTVSYVRNGSLVISPQLTVNAIGAAGLAGADVNLWGGDPATACTDNGFFGCERTGGGGGNIINPVLSARVRTAETFAFKYGRVEVVARMPRGDWMWPAIWLMPTEAAYGQWPASGEIDIAESRGNARGYPAGGCESFGSTLHYGPYWPEDAYLTTHATYSAPSGDLSTDFHTYGLLWTAERMTTYIDNTVVLDVNINETFWSRGGFATSQPGISSPWQDSPNANAPFDQRMYILLNVAVGGTNGYFPDAMGGKPWSDTSDSAANLFWAAYASQWGPTWASGSPMMIDSVTVRQDPAQGEYRLAISSTAQRLPTHPPPFSFSPSAGGDYAFRPML